MTNKEMQDLIVKAKILNIIKAYPTYCKHTYYLISKSKDSYIMLIPNDVIEITNVYSLVDKKYDYTLPLQKLRGTLEVIGGASLKSASSIFKKCNLERLILNEFVTDNIIDMRGMFESACIKQLDISRFNTSKVTDMNQMFKYFSTDNKLSELDFSKFDTSNVTDMTAMFKCCGLERLDLHSFDVSNVKHMEQMFSYSSASYINLESFKVNKDAYIEKIFFYIDDCTEIKTKDLRLKLESQNRLDKLY